MGAIFGGEKGAGKAKGKDDGARSADAVVQEEIWKSSVKGGQGRWSVGGKGKEQGRKEGEGCAPLWGDFGGC